MAAAQIPYIKLPGKGCYRQGWSSLAHSTCTLWLGPDHLLHLKRSTFSESYKRFYYRDIQRIVMQRTGFARNFNLFLMITAAAAVFGAVVFAGDILTPLLLIAAAALLLILIGNAALGPTCAVHILTHVQDEKLPSLSRLRHFRKANQILQKRIREEQMDMQISAADIAATLAAATADRHDLTDSNTDHVSGRKYHTHEYLFYALLAQSTGLAAHIHFNHTVSALLVVLLTLALTTLSLLALITYYRSYPRSLLGGFTWLTFTYSAFCLIMGYLAQFVISLRHLNTVNNMWQQLQAAAAVSLTDSPFLFSISAGCCITAFGLGLTGLVILRRVHTQCSGTLNLEL